MKLTFGSFAATGVAAITAAAIALPAQAATEITVSTALDQKHDQSQAFFDTFFKKMKEDESEVKLKYIGGPEVTPNRKQGPAMKRGLIDIIMSPSTYYSSHPARGQADGYLQRPAAGMAHERRLRHLRRCLGEEDERDHSRMGQFLHHRAVFRLADRQAQAQQGDRARPQGHEGALDRALHALLQGDGRDPEDDLARRGLYRARAGRGQGPRLAGGGVAFRGWQRFIKYRILPGFFRSTTMATMNKDKFESLSKKAQTQILAAGLHYENASGQILKKKAQIDNEKIRKEGVQDYHLPPEYAKVYISTILGAKWADAAKRKYTVPFEELKSKMLKLPGS